MGQRSESVKAVFDTNILISALGWNGKPEECLKKVFDDSITGYTSPDILRELALVMDYPHLDFKESEKQRFLSQIATEFHIVQPEPSVEVCRDPDDNKFLDCALAADGSYVVSGDSDLLDLEEYEGIQIVSPSTFLEEI
jgi:putative PIN family toxin of toxin-antitoxin system